MRATKTLIIFSVLIICLSIFASALPSLSRAELQNLNFTRVFKSLETNNKLGQADFVFDNPLLHALNVDDLNVSFNTVKGRASNLHLFTNSSCSTVKPLYTINQVCGYRPYVPFNVSYMVFDENSPTHYECWDNVTEVGNQTVTEECFVPLTTISRQPIKIRVQADIGLIKNNETGNWEAAIDWIPGLRANDGTFLQNTRWAWWNLSYANRILFNCSNITGNYPVLLGGIAGVVLNGSQQQIYTTCNQDPDFGLYYNNATDYAVANGTSIRPFKVGKGNGTSYQPTSAFGLAVSYYTFDNAGTSTFENDSVGSRRITAGAAPGSVSSPVTNARGPTNMPFSNLTAGVLSTTAATDYTVLVYANLTVYATPGPDTRTPLVSVGINSGSSYLSYFGGYDDTTSWMTYEKGGVTGGNCPGGVGGKTPKNQYHWWVMSNNGTSKTAYGYIDEVNVASCAFGTTGEAATNRLYLGGSPYTGQDYLSEAWYINRTLTTNEIAGFYYNYIGTPGFASSLNTEVREATIFPTLGINTTIYAGYCNLTATTFSSPGDYNKQFRYSWFRNNNLVNTGNLSANATLINGISNYNVANYTNISAINDDLIFQCAFADNFVGTATNSSRAVVASTLSLTNYTLPINMSVQSYSVTAGDEVGWELNVTDSSFKLLGIRVFPGTAINKFVVRNSTNSVIFNQTINNTLQTFFNLPLSVGRYFLGVTNTSGGFTFYYNYNTSYPFIYTKANVTNYYGNGSVLTSAMDKAYYLTNSYQVIDDNLANGVIVNPASTYAFDHNAATFAEVFVTSTGAPLTLSYRVGKNWSTNKVVTNVYVNARAFRSSGGLASSIFLETFNGTAWSTFSTLASTNPTATFTGTAAVNQNVKGIAVRTSGSGSSVNMEGDVYDLEIYGNVSGDFGTAIQNIWVETLPINVTPYIVPSNLNTTSIIQGYCNVTVEPDQITNLALNGFLRDNTSGLNLTVRTTYNISGTGSYNVVNYTSNAFLYTHNIQMVCNATNSLGTTNDTYSQNYFVNGSVTINVTSNITPALLYTNTLLQGFCTPIAGEATGLNTSGILNRTLNSIETLQANGSFNNATTGITYNVLNYSLSTSDYSSFYNLYCRANNVFNDTGFITTISSKRVNSIISFNQSAFTDSSTLITPQIGDLIQLNASATDNDNISYCNLQVNDTGAWRNPVVNTYNVTFNTNGTNINVPFTFVVTNNSNANNSNVSWRAVCVDTLGTSFTSNASVFSVKDTTAPQIVIGPNSFNFNTNNLSILSGDLYTANYNLTYVDPNLFAVEVNISCAQSGQIYYFVNTSIGLQNYTKAANVPINYPLQRCNFFTAVSDSHTSESIPEYDTEVLDNGLSFRTENDNLVQILATDVPTDVNTVKLSDRQTFEFSFPSASTIRQFTVTSDKELHYIEESEYPAHFVVYNPTTHAGNWIDFTDQINVGDTYEVTKINEFEYQVTVTTPTPTDELHFESIGGTLVTNYSLNFYIGGTVYIFTNNTFNNQSFSNFSLVFTNVDSFPGINLTATITSNTSTSIQNISAGNYTLALSSGQYFPQFNNLTIANLSTNITYRTHQAEASIIFRNVKTHEILTNVTYNITGINFSYRANTNGSNSTYFVFNAGNYNITMSAPGYINSTQLFTISYLDNTTLIFDLGYTATFRLYDEKLSTTTGSNVAFNVAGATSVSFLLFCPGTTTSTLINTSNFTASITCDYTKFQFLLLYNTTSYYRSFILDPSTSLDYPIYLIDSTTTPYLFNSIVADDLLDKYINPSIYVLKTIGNQTVQITADFADIEQKIGAYLIENNQYIVEIHSDNLPTYVVGTYAADTSGTKNIRLYQVGVYDENAGTSTGSIAQISVVNATLTNTTVLYRYKDDYNTTTSVSFTLYQNNAPICTDTLSNNNNFVVACDVSNYNTTTVMVEQTITRAGVTNTIQNVIHEVTTLELGIVQYFGQSTINWFLIVVISALALFGTIQTANLYTFALLGVAVLFNVFGWLVMSTSVLAFTIMVALIAIFKEGDKTN